VLHDRVDRVARGARHVVHDGTLVARDGVQQRALADVRAPYDRNAQLFRLLFVLGRRR
jgi:hypothetical protein